MGFGQHLPGGCLGVGLAPSPSSLLQGRRTMVGVKWETGRTSYISGMWHWGKTPWSSWVTHLGKYLRCECSAEPQEYWLRCWAEHPCPNPGTQENTNMEGEKNPIRKKDKIIIILENIIKILTLSKKNLGGWQSPAKSVWLLEILIFSPLILIVV